MRSTKTITIVQEVHVPHHETIVRTWHDSVQRTIEREIDDDGTILSEPFLDTDLIDANCDREEETIENDTDLEPEEIVASGLHMRVFDRMAALRSSGQRRFRNVRGRAAVDYS